MMRAAKFFPAFEVGRLYSWGRPHTLKTSQVRKGGLPPLSQKIL